MSAISDLGISWISKVYISFKKIFLAVKKNKNKEARQRILYSSFHYDYITLNKHAMALLRKHFDPRAE